MRKPLLAVFWIAFWGNLATSQTTDAVLSGVVRDPIGLPISEISNPNFGRITNATGNRVVVVTMRFNF